MIQNNDIISKIKTVIYNENKYIFRTELSEPLNIFYNEICSYFINKFK